MGDVLGKDEIDALLTKREEKERGRPKEAATQRVVRSYDFKHPARVNKDQLRTLENLHDNFARLMSSTLSGAMRAVVDVDTAFVDQTTYAEYIMSLSNPSCSYQFTLGPTNGQAILDIAMPITFAFVDRVFGGKGSSQGVDARQMSQIEMGVIARVLKRMVADLEHTWAPILHVDIHDIELETNPEFMQITAASEIVILLAFEVNSTNASGLISLCYPFFTLESILPRLGQQIYVRQGRLNYRETVRQNQLRLGNTPVPVRAELGRNLLTLDEAGSLQPGDVVQLEARPGEPVVVFSGEHPKYLGLPFVGGHGNTMVKIAGAIPAELEEIYANQSRPGGTGGSEEINLTVTAQLGATSMTLDDLMGLGAESAVELDRLAGEPIDLLLNDSLVARGEIVTVNQYFGVRITEIAGARNGQANQGERLLGFRHLLREDPRVETWVPPGSVDVSGVELPKPRVRDLEPVGELAPEQEIPAVEPVSLEDDKAETHSNDVEQEITSEQLVENLIARIQQGDAANAHEETIKRVRLFVLEHMEDSASLVRTYLHESSAAPSQQEMGFYEPESWGVSTEKRPPVSKRIAAGLGRLFSREKPVEDEESGSGRYEAVEYEEDWDERSRQNDVSILILALGPEISGELMKRLSDKEIEEIVHGVAWLQGVSLETQVRVMEEFEQHLLGGEWLTEGGYQIALDAVTRAVGPHKAREIVERVARAVSSGFYVFRNVAPEQVAPFISHEHPQTIALILSQLDPAQGSGILTQLPERMQSDVAYRIATMENVSPAILKEVEEDLEHALSDILGGNQEVGGPKVVADLLNLTGSSVEKNVLDAMDAGDAEVAEAVRNLMFVFNDLGKLTDRELQVVLREVDQKDLVVALKAATPETAKKLLHNMSERVRQFIVEELEFLGTMRLSEVEEVQLRIVQIVRELEQKGQITIVRGDADDMFV